MKAKKITLEQAIDQIENYVPTSIPAEKFAPVRSYVIETMKTVATYAKEHPKAFPLTARAITHYTGALATHCVTVKESHGDILNEDELFNGELIAWSVAQLPLSDSTKAKRLTVLRKIDTVLKDTHLPASLDSPRLITSAHTPARNCTRLSARFALSPRTPEVTTGWSSWHSGFRECCWMTCERCALSTLITDRP